MFGLTIYSALVITSIAYIIYCLFDLLNFFYKIWILPMRVKPIDLKSTGEWAVITGCTDGIGREFALQLAKKGMNLILVSRSEEKLKKLQHDLSDKHNIKVKTIAIDFTKITNNYTRVEKHLENLDVGVLVNNVGKLNGYKRFLDDGYDVMRDVVEINVKGTVLMTSIILPKMVDKKKGVVINLGSYSSLVETPHMTCYGATKKFILKFSEDLRREYGIYGITIQCLTPFFIRTKLSKIESENFFVPTSEKYVASALNTVGVHKVTCGYFSHDLLIVLHRLGSQFTPFLSKLIGVKLFYTLREKSKMS